MAFMGRGSFPSIGNNDVDIDQDNCIRNQYYNHYRYGPIYYVPLDNTYVIMQMIITFIILIVGFIIFLATYKSAIVDPIENIKRLFINAHLAIIGILLGITVIVNFFSKGERVLIKRLAIIFIISIIVMLVFFGIKLNLDTTYTRNKFEQFYVEQNIVQNPDNKLKTTSKSKIDIGISGVSIKTEEEYYIDECIKLYNIFKIKTYGTLGLHFLLNILFIYQMLRISKIQGKKDKINNDDLILFDEEENVKI